MMLSSPAIRLIGTLRQNGPSKDTKQRRISLERMNTKISNRRKSLPTLPSYLLSVTKSSIEKKTKSSPKTIKKQRKGVKFPLGVLMQQAVTDGDLQEMRQLITDFGSKSVEEREPSGLPPVMRAIFEGQVDCLKLLADAGADLTAQDPEHWTTLHVAAAMDDLDAAEIILSSCSKGVGSMTQSRNMDGEKPLDLAESVEMARLLLNADLREFRLESDAQSETQSTTENEEASVLRLVLDHCKDNSCCTAMDAVLKTNTCYDSLLHLAACKNYPRLTEFVCSRRLSSLEVRDSKGWTPLHTAAYYNSLDIVMVLVQHRSNTHALTHSFEKPADLTEHELILSVLEDAEENSLESV